MIVQIEVTQAHIDRGIKSNCVSCPIALSISEVIKATIKLQAHFNTIFLFGPDDLNYEIMTPMNVSGFMLTHDYDHLGGVSPFTFPLDIPQWALKAQS